MKNHNVTITGQQKHISGNSFENQTESEVNAIIEKYWDEDYPKPQFDGESWELNNDQYIRIEKNMTENEKFNKLLNQIGDRKDLADYLCMSYGNVKNLLRPSRELPVWAKSMLYVKERWQNKNNPEPPQSDRGSNEPEI